MRIDWDPNCQTNQMTSICQLSTLSEHLSSSHIRQTRWLQFANCLPFLSTWVHLTSDKRDDFNLPTVYPFWALDFISHQTNEMTSICQLSTLSEHLEFISHQTNEMTSICQLSTLSENLSSSHIRQTRWLQFANCLPFLRTWVHPTSDKREVFNLPTVYPFWELEFIPTFCVCSLFIFWPYVWLST
jgi:hypothetical protein